ncbi:MAG TPA: M24 family metallopeptidase, partial [Mycobacteriales bacterium]|nr:M24 family metallopeptidase [Mycobacteriales bacterium]
DEVTVAGYDKLAAACGETSLVRLGPLVERLRSVKDDGELALLREACAIGDRALARLLPRITPGRSERWVAAQLDALLVAEGADGPGFESIVAAGPNSAVPHHRPTERVLATGDLLKMDFGGRYQGYHADMTRTFVLGPPADWQREIYDLVAAAQQVGREALAPGAAARDVDAAARSVIVDAGYGGCFPHGLGHGVGLEIHEAPYLGERATATLAAQVPVTVEPGIYLPGRGGVRIEDTLVVRPDGAELLTTTPKDLVVL